MLFKAMKVGSHRLVLIVDTELRKIYKSASGLPMLDIKECSLVQVILNEMLKKPQSEVDKYNLKIIDSIIRNNTDMGVFTSSDEGKKKKKGYIYAASDSTHKFIKIGFTTSLRARESTLQAEKPTITFEYSRPGTISDEHKIHLVLGHLRYRGEWFNIPLDKAISTINKIMDIV